MKKGPLVVTGYIGDEILPIYEGIIINHEVSISIKWKVRPGFFQGSTSRSALKRADFATHSSEARPSACGKMG